MSKKLLLNVELFNRHNNNINSIEAKCNVPIRYQSIWLKKLAQYGEIGDSFCSNIREGDKVPPAAPPANQAAPAVPAAPAVLAAKPSRLEVFGSVTDTSKSMIDEEKEEIRENYADECRLIEAILNMLIKLKKIDNTHKNSVCVEFWAEKIGRLGKKYNMPAEVISAIIGNSSKFMEKPPTKVFVKNQNKGEFRDKTTCGIMHVQPERIMEFFPEEKGNKYEQYKRFAGDLLHDILYDSDNNLKYKNCEDLIKACDEDQELSIMVGILIFKTEEILTLEEIMTGNKNPDLETAINNLTKNIEYLSEKLGEDTLSHEFVQGKALKRYFGCPVKGRLAYVYSRLSTTAPKSISE